MLAYSSEQWFQQWDEAVFRHFLLRYLLFLAALIGKGRRGDTWGDPLHNLKASTLPTKVCTVRFLRVGTLLCVPGEVYKLHIPCKLLFRINNLYSFSSCCYIQLFKNGLPENFMPALPICKVPCPNDKLSLKQVNWYAEA